jgi:hypothetical protein
VAWVLEEEAMTGSKGREKKKEKEKEKEEKRE